MEAPMKMAGMNILCPGCKALLQIPQVELSAEDASELKKKATEPITSLGGIPPDPAPRHVIIKRLPPKKKK